MKKLGILFFIQFLMVTIFVICPNVEAAEADSIEEIVPACRANTLNGDTAIYSTTYPINESKVVKLHMPEDGKIYFGIEFSSSWCGYKVFNDSGLNEVYRDSNGFESTFRVNDGTDLKKGDYYILLTGAISDDIFEVQAEISAYYYPCPELSKDPKNTWRTGTNFISDEEVRTRKSEINVKNNSILTVEFYNSLRADITIRKYSTLNNRFAEDAERIFKKKGKVEFYVCPGKYYLELDGNNYQFKYSLKKVSKPVNLTKNKAKKIKMNVNNEMILFGTDSSKTWTRWYKIKIDKKKKLKYWTNYSTIFMHIDLFDSRGKKVKFNEKSCTSVKAVPKGTYYIKCKFDKHTNDKVRRNGYNVKFKIKYK